MTTRFSLIYEGLPVYEQTITQSIFIIFLLGAVTCFLECVIVDYCLLKLGLIKEYNKSLQLIDSGILRC